MAASSAMKSTGLVSLNVHEALHFDGTPICLHPDLFSATTTTTALDPLRLPVHATLDDATTASGGTGASEHRHVATATAATATGVRTATTTALDDVESTTLPTTGGSNVHTSLLQVGDLLEIRVWDALKTLERHTHQPSLSTGAKPLPVTRLPPLLPNRITVEPSSSLTRPPLMYRSTTGQMEKAVPTPSLHVRDLSDMTTDTLTGSAAAPPMGTSGACIPLMASPPRVTMVPPGSSYDETEDTPGDDSVAPMVADDADTVWMTRMQQSHQLRLSFVMSVTPQTLTSLHQKSTRQVSILRHVADLYHLSTFDRVSIHRLVTPDERDAALATVAADFLLVTIKDQFISRGDMHSFQHSLTGQWIYDGERLHDATRGVQANAREIRHGHKRGALVSGIVTPSTKITFRSRSARIIWLVQLSSEMWEYASPYEEAQAQAHASPSGETESLCQLYFDKWIAFIHKLFAKWKELEATHSLTVVFFSRSFLTATNEPNQYDMYGRCFQDHYRVVLESETGPDWDSLVVKIKQAFVQYPFEMNWTVSTQDGEGDQCWPSTANQGNVLEAINVTLNMLQYHYLDRDLQRTGNSIVVISAGNGVFEVDKSLAGISYQRMVDNGIGSDVLSVGLPPLHIAPFFLYSTPHKSPREMDTTPQEHYYEIPHWMHLSFVDYESDEAVFVDHLFEAEDSKRNRQQVDDQPDLVILSNGFLLPRTDTANDKPTPTKPLVRPQTYSDLAHDKPRLVSHQRKLIEGREFRDILEACRPRHARSIPSALKALVRTRAEPSPAPGGAWEDMSTTRVELEEWGMLDPEAVKQETSILGRSAVPAPDGRRSPFQFPNSPQISADGDEDGALDLSSQASSIASVMLSTSHERSPYRVQPPSPSGGVCELQRSLSLRMIATDDEESSLVPPNDPGVYDSPGVEDKGDSTVARLRAMMQSHDDNMWCDETASTSMEQPPASVASRQPSGFGRSRHPKDAPSDYESSDGLGAALSRHGQPSVGYTSMMDARSPVLNRTNSLAGISSVSSQASYRRMFEMGSQGLSPMLLPHVAQKMMELPESRQDWLPPSHIPLESRFVKPQQYAARGRTVGVRINVKASAPALIQPGQAAQSSRSLSVSPPSNKSFGSPPKEFIQRRLGEGRQTLSNKSLGSPPKEFTQRRPGESRHSARQQGSSATSSRSNATSRKKKVFNPFRQQDEEDVLALKTHNRRRWSHVFPLGEVEFKRHAGPNWKSLTAPAILPLSVDYFPTQEEIDRKFTFSSYNVTLSEFERKNYASNKDLFVEMVRQRLTQDFQLVSDDRINVKHYRREASQNRAHGLTTADDRTLETNRQFLSMGHRLHVITYDPSADLIEVYRYDDKDTQKNLTFDYRYRALCQETQTYGKTRQTFTKYSAPYNWNKVDNIICGDADMEMREGMRFKRIMFGILPESFQGDLAAEEAYVAKFRRFLDYLDKLRDTDESSNALDITFVTSQDKQQQEESKRMESTPGVERNSMVRIYIQLKKGKRDNLEWMEVALDSTFDTSWSYRIMFNWLVASSGKVDAQVQLLQRRCAQFGLKVVPFPQITVSRNIYLNPFKAPAVLTVSVPVDILRLQHVLEKLDYVHDGVFSTEVDALLECMDHKGVFCFKQVSQSPWFSRATMVGQKTVPTETNVAKKFYPTMGKQFVHRSGTLFVRVLTDLNGLFVLVVLGNYRYMTVNKGEAVATAYQSAFGALTNAVAELNSTEAASSEEGNASPGHSH